MLVTIDVDIKKLGRLIGEADGLYEQEDRDNWFDADDMMHEAACIVRDGLKGNEAFLIAYDEGFDYAYEEAR